MNSKKIAVLWLCLVMIFSFIVIVVEIPQPVKAGTIWVDDDYVVEDPTHKKTIQAAVDNATPGDTVFVYNGIYYENLMINKIINLIGEDRENTIINGSKSSHVVEITADWINITGFTITNSGSQALEAGIKLTYGSYIRIYNNNISGNNYHGIYGDYPNGNFIRIYNNKIVNNVRGGVWFQYGPFEYGEINNNTIIRNRWGINLNGGSPSENCRYFKVNNNTLLENWVGMHINCVINSSIKNNKIFNSELNGFHSGLYSRFNIFSNNTLELNGNGTVFNRESFNIYENNTINSTVYSVKFLGSYSSLVTFVNCSFDKSKVYFEWPKANFTVKWYLHINVEDYLGNPVPNAIIKIEDNINSSYNESFITDSNGYLKWLTVSEYIEQDTDGNTKGEKTYHTPHKIVAWNDTLVGYAQPIMNESKTVTIVLYNGTLLNLEPGWNLVSLPKIQSDTNLQTVLQSIEGQYDAVQWYNITDSNDPWKHNHISKPSNWNDLNDVNHTMGLWVHVTDPGGTTLVVFGDVLTSTHNIALYPGWNLVGYPSTTDKIRISALNNVIFDTEVDAIWTHNATTQKWKEITASDNYEVGRGYWIHSKVTKTWIVPL